MSISNDSNDNPSRHHTQQRVTGTQKKTTASQRKAKPKESMKQLERKQLYEFQHNQAIRRFPTRLSNDAEIDRLRILVAQCLAVMDRLLEFWELRQCPFQDVPDKLIHAEQSATSEPESGKPEVSSNDKQHSPYH